MLEKDEFTAKAFDSVVLNPKTNGVCVVVPNNSPFFEPVRCRITCLDLENPELQKDVKIGAVTIGGSPQLAINTLTPDERSTALHPNDIDYVNWSVFSTIGLARELQISLYNPNNSKVVVFVCIDGREVINLDSYYDGDYEERSEEVDKKQWADTRNRQDNNDYGDHISSEEISLKPLSTGILTIIPAISPFFEPGRIKPHGHRVDNGAPVPYTITEAICGNRMLYGAHSLVDLFSMHLADGKDAYSETSLEDVIHQLQRIAGKRKGSPESDSSYDTRRIPGMLTSHIIEKNGWGNVSKWSEFSTIGLGSALSVIVHNPWAFRIRASMSMLGHSVTALKKTKIRTERPESPEHLESEAEG